MRRNLTITGLVVGLVAATTVWLGAGSAQAATGPTVTSWITTPDRSQLMARGTSPVFNTDGSRPGHAELTLQREFMNEPGHAAAFAVGDIHSIEFGDDTFFIRVTGGDVETKETHRFDVDKKTVEVANRAKGER